MTFSAFEIQSKSIENERWRSSCACVRPKRITKLDFTVWSLPDPPPSEHHRAAPEQLSPSSHSHSSTRIKPHHDSRPPPLPPLPSPSLPARSPLGRDLRYHAAPRAVGPALPFRHGPRHSRDDRDGRHKPPRPDQPLVSGASILPLPPPSKVPPPPLPQPPPPSAPTSPPFPSAIHPVPPPNRSHHPPPPHRTNTPHPNKLEKTPSPPAPPAARAIC